MSNYLSLRQPLKQYFNLHGARLSCLILILTSLMISRSCNFVRLSLYFATKALPQSNEKRISRFLKDCEINTSSLVRFLMALFKLDNIKLALDRTQWSYGVLNLNLLTLSVIHKDIAFPVMIYPLSSKGNSSSAMRINMIFDFISSISCHIDYLVADREFIGDQWLSYLQEIGLRYVIRCRENQFFNSQKGLQKKAKALFANLTSGYCTSWLMKNGLYLTGARATNGQLWVLLSNIFDGEEAVEVYASRWKIEVAFGVLKSRGFDLESTHITDLSRLVSLIKVMTIAVAWAYLQGEIQAKAKPIKIKKKRLAVSIFRYGLDYIVAQISAGKTNSIIKTFKKLIKTRHLSHQRHFLSGA